MYKVYLSMGAIALIVVALLYAIYGESMHASASCNGEHSEEDWVSCINIVGPEEAYEHFKKRNAKFDFPIDHDQAHIFSGAIFEVLGNKGVDICDTSFGGGCYHEFFSRAFSTDGASAFNEMAQTCDSRETVEDTIECRHGFGHGLVVFSGHSSDGLKEALELCDDAFPVRIEGGYCYDGAFMEYNLRNSIGAQSMSFRKFNQDNVYEPCDVLPTRYKEACYFRAAQLWSINRQDEDFDARHRDMLNWCDKVPDSEYRNSCIVGVSGTIMWLGITSRDEALSFCFNFLKTPEDQNLCTGFVYGSEHFKYNEGDYVFPFLNMTETE